MYEFIRQGEGEIKCDTKEGERRYLSFLVVPDLDCPVLRGAEQLQRCISGQSDVLLPLDSTALNLTDITKCPMRHSHPPVCIWSYRVSAVTLPSESYAGGCLLQPVQQESSTLHCTSPSRIIWSCSQYRSDNRQVGQIDKQQLQFLKADTRLKAQ